MKSYRKLSNINVAIIESESVSQPSAKWRQQRQYQPQWLLYSENENIIEINGVMKMCINHQRRRQSNQRRSAEESCENQRKYSSKMKENRNETA
jgi:hypothetical protein